MYYYCFIYPKYPQYLLCLSIQAWSCHLPCTAIYPAYISTTERQKGLTTSRLHTQLDPFASKLLRHNTTVMLITLYTISQGTGLTSMYPVAMDLWLGTTVDRLFAILAYTDTALLLRALMR